MNGYFDLAQSKPHLLFGDIWKHILLKCSLYKRLLKCTRFCIRFVNCVATESYWVCLTHN